MSGGKNMSGSKRASLSVFAGASPKRGAKAGGKTTPATRKAASAEAKQAAAASGRPPSRQNKRVISVYVEPEALKQLSFMAVDEDTSIQALMVEALNDFFAKRGVNRIA
ncbi:MAG TPA: ribbon-helix-helix domain-containing protein [Acetobacteraceae bacterium]|nr:ribbon-helix-helix domain-containing protein [Acetobacteraceae bacterium]